MNNLNIIFEIILNKLYIIYLNNEKWEFIKNRYEGSIYLEYHKNYLKIN